MTQTADAFTAVESALRNLATALATGDADQVLAAEGPLQIATAGLAAVRLSPVPPDAARVRQAWRSILMAVLECQALGASAEVLRRVLVPDTAYSHGRRTASAIHTLDSRV